jgi:DNA-binding transcriptional regulator GbsR (MarR family)
MRETNTPFGEDEGKIEAVLTNRSSTISELQRATQLSKSRVITALGNLYVRDHARPAEERNGEKVWEVVPPELRLVHQ